MATYIDNNRKSWFVIDKELKNRETKPITTNKKNTSNKQQPIHTAHKFFQQVAEARRGLNAKDTTTT